MAARLQRHRALHDVLELADVAGPLVGLERGHGFRREPVDGLLHLAREPGQELFGDEGHVAGAVPKRRQLDGNHVEPVEEVLAELPLGDRPRQVAVGGGDDPDVRGNLLGAADAPELALLQHAEELDLHGRGHLADLVEKDGPAFGDFHEALLGGVRARERAAHVPEQLRFEQRLGHGAAVHRHERPLAPERLLVDGLCHQLLAGPGLTGDQDGAVGAAHRFHQPEDVEHGRAAADDAREALLDRGAAQHRVLVAQASRLEQLPHLHGHEVDVAERLLEEGLGAELPRVLPSIRVPRPVRRHHQDDGVGGQLANRAEQLHTVDAGHLDVGENHVHVLARDDLPCRQPVVGRQHLEAIALEQDAQPLAHRLFVIDNQNPGHGAF